MKLFSAIVLLTLLILPIYGQLITGKVVDSGTGEPLVYASIGIIGTPVGAITDENGNFKIDVTGQPLNAIIRISLISYQPQTITVEEACNKENTIKLISAPTQLAEVVIRPSGKLKQVGITTFDRKWVGGWPGYEYGKGHECGLRIKLGSSPVKIMSMHIFVYKQSFDTSIFRLHVRSIAHRRPSEELLSDNIFITITKNSGLVDIDLSQYNLVFKGDIALSLEWVKVIGVHIDRFYNPKNSTMEPMPVVFFNCSNKGLTYTKRGSENKWLLTKHYPSIYLTVQE